MPCHGPTSCVLSLQQRQRCGAGVVFWRWRPLPPGALRGGGVVCPASQFTPLPVTPLPPVCHGVGIRCLGSLAVLANLTYGPRSADRLCHPRQRHWRHGHQAGQHPGCGGGVGGSHAVKDRGAKTPWAPVCLPACLPACQPALSWRTIGNRSAALPAALQACRHPPSKSPS